jgi:cytochrome c
MRNLMLSAGLTVTLFLPACSSSKDESAQDTSQTKAAETVVGSVAVAGKAAFASCAICHNNVQGAAAKMGPNLYGIFGKKAAATEGYTYSSALKASGITWTEAELDAFLTSPSTKVPGTKMGAGGVSDPERRKAVIVYLKETAA